jgi:hypothetical protein
MKRYQRELVDLQNMFLSSQKANYLQQDIIEQKSLTTTNEVDNQRNERLKTHKETQQLVRTNVESFDRDINVFAETICEVCSKHCYPNQFSRLNLSNCGFPSYLPQELSEKMFL